MYKIEKNIVKIKKVSYIFIFNINLLTIFITLFIVRLRKRIANHV